MRKTLAAAIGKVGIMALLAAVGGGVAAGQPQAQAAGSIFQTPLAFPRKHPVVEVRVNGTPLRFVVDTAAGATVVDQAMAARLGLATDAAEQRTVEGASGGAAFAMVKAERIEVGGAERRDMGVILADMSRIAAGYDGILGNDFLRHYAVLLDVPGGMLKFADSDIFAPTGADCLTSPVADPRPDVAGFSFVPAALADAGSGRRAEVVAVVDSGASQTIMNWHAARGLGLVLGDARLRLREAGTPGFAADRKAAETYLFTLDRFTAGGWSVAGAEVRIADLPVFKAVGLDDRPALILGADFLRQRPVAIGKGASRVCFLGGAGKAEA